jgi:ribonuclease HI
MDQNFFVYTDGASRGNPGYAAAGFLIFDGQRNLVHKEGDYLGIATNNEAEYQAVILALKTLKKLNAKKIDFFLDSMLVVKQIKGEFKIKEPRMGKLYLEIKNLLNQMGLSASFTHIRREQNKEADALVNEILDKEHKK